MKFTPKNYLKCITLCVKAISFNLISFNWNSCWTRGRLKTEDMNSCPSSLLGRFSIDSTRSTIFQKIFKIKIVVSFSSHKNKKLQVLEGIQPTVLVSPQTATQYYPISAISVLNSTVRPLYQTAEWFQRFHVQTPCLWYLPPIRLLQAFTAKQLILI